MSRAARRVLLALIVALVACADPDDVPDEVYVPAPDYTQTLRIATLADSAHPARAGAWVTLTAQRRTGPWRLVPRDSANLEQCWWRRPPEASEPEVAANVTWRAQPADSVTFDSPEPPEMKRRVRFPRAGTYTLTAESHGCPHGLASRDTITIVVAP